MTPLVLLSLLMAFAWATPSALDEMAKDDECAVDGGDGACALNALQLRKAATVRKAAQPEWEGDQEDEQAREQDVQPQYDTQDQQPQYDTQDQQPQDDTQDLEAQYDTQPEGTFQRSEGPNDELEGEPEFQSRRLQDEDEQAPQRDEYVVERPDDEELEAEPEFQPRRAQDDEQPVEYVEQEAEPEFQPRMAQDDEHPVVYVEREDEPEFQPRRAQDDEQPVVYVEREAEPEFQPRRVQDEEYDRDLERPVYDEPLGAEEDFDDRAQERPVEYVVVDERDPRYETREPEFDERDPRYEARPMEAPVREVVVVEGPDGGYYEEDWEEPLEPPPAEEAPEEEPNETAVPEEEEANETAVDGSDVNDTKFTDRNTPDTFPDLSTGEDVAGPYLEEPTDEQANNPEPAKPDWENETVAIEARMSASSATAWGNSFCASHQTGYFCDGTTQVRCCRQDYGFVKCGSTVHSTQCGWSGGGGYYPGGGGGYYPDSRRRGGWVIHPGWRPSSFCRSHHVGHFCYQHTQVHCCNDYGHYVDCSTTTESRTHC